MSKQEAYARNKLINFIVQECLEYGWDYDQYDDHIVVWVGKQT